MLILIWGTLWLTKRGILATFNRREWWRSVITSKTGHVTRDWHTGCNKMYKIRTMEEVTSFVGIHNLIREKCLLLWPSVFPIHRMYSTTSTISSLETCELKTKTSRVRQLVTQWLRRPVGVNDRNLWQHSEKVSRTDSFYPFPLLKYQTIDWLSLSEVYRY